MKTGNISQKELTALFEHQRKAFLASDREDWSERRRRLVRLRELISGNADRLAQAVSEDFHGKPVEEVYFAEISQILSEIDLMLAQGPVWSRTRRVRTPWMFFRRQVLFVRPRAE